MTSDGEHTAEVASETGHEASAGHTARGLDAPNLPQPPLRSRWFRALIMLFTTALIVGWCIWYARTPEPLPTDETEVSASGVVGTPVYVGMFSPPAAFDRSIRIHGVKLHTTASAEVEVTPLLCRGGAIGVTTQPQGFCTALENPEGTTLGPSDSIVVEVSGDQPALAQIDRIRIGFREGLRWATEPAGHAGAQVSLIAAG